MRYAYPKLERTGLGNMLFPWAQAVVYCQHTHARMIAPKWVHLCRIGTWIRKERDKRFYLKQFSGSNYVSGAKRWLLLYFCRNRVRFFSGMKGFFDSFITEHNVVYNELMRIVNQTIKNKVEKIAKDCPYIAVHVRRGDFKTVGISTDDAWYLRAIKIAVSDKVAQGVNTIRVFSDARPGELKFIAEAFPEKEVIVMPNAPAIEDILLLSKAKIVVCTPRSTFSMWSVFLGQQPSIWQDGPVELLPPRLYIDENKAKLVK